MFFYAFSFSSHCENGCLSILYFPKPEIPKGNGKEIEKRSEVPPGLGSM